MELAARLRGLREEAGMTQTALARPRYTVSYVSQIEAGRRKPSQEALSFFADRLGVTPGFLATGVPEDLEESLRYQLEEARRGLREGRAPESERVVAPVIRQCEQYGLDDVRSQALVVLGEALVLQGRLREAVDAFEEGLEGTLPSRDTGRAVSGLARAYRAVGDLTYATETVESFLGRKGRPPLDPELAAELQAVLVSIYFERGDILRAERAAHRALTAAEQGAPLEVRANAYWDASRVLAESKRWAEALDLATRARVLMEELDNRRQVARLHNAYGYLCLEAEPPRVTEAATHLGRAEALFATGIGTPVELAYVHTEKARVALLRSQFDEAVRLCDVVLTEVGDDELEAGRCLLIRGRALAELGRLEDARETLSRAAVVFGDHGARQQEALAWGELGELDLAQGDVDGAVKALRAGLRALGPPRYLR